MKSPLPSVPIRRRTARQEQSEMSGFRFLLRLLVSIALLFSAPWARAGIQHVDCRHPIVFPGSAVNVVVLSYRHMGTTEASLSDAGKRLSLLVKLDNLYHILPYGSIGSVQMEL